MKVMTPAGEWEAKEDFSADGTIAELIEFLIEEMELRRGDIFEIVDGNGKVISADGKVGMYCDSYLELVATGTIV